VGEPQNPLPRVVGIDHLVLSVGDLARSKDFCSKVLGFLCFKLKYDYDDMVGWSNRKTLFSAKIQRPFTAARVHP
jgi:catechol 2,3-dioxygenase-like lactoylglutathione lyase family enzyme